MGSSRVTGGFWGLKLLEEKTLRCIMGSFIILGRANSFRRAKFPWLHRLHYELVGLGENLKRLGYGCERIIKKKGEL